MLDDANFRPKEYFQVFYERIYRLLLTQSENIEMLGVVLLCKYASVF